MKILIALLAIAIATPAALAQTAAQQAEGYYQKGLAAEKAGEPETAIAAYKAVLMLVPGHANATYRAGQVKINAKSIKSAATEAKIGAVMIPLYQLDKATVQDAIELLSIKMEKETNGEIAPNFIIEDPKNKLENAQVTMNLKNIPVKNILEYLLTQTNTKARFDEHAVVILAR
jgi:tetratricopeptide (TPR) repeat protein